MTDFIKVVYACDSVRNKKPPNTANVTKSAEFSGCLVPMTGLEPVRVLRRGILSPLRLPIPPHRQIFQIILLWKIFVQIFWKILVQIIVR